MYTEQPGPQPSFSYSLLAIRLSSQALSTTDALAIQHSLSRSEAAQVFREHSVGDLIGVLDEFAQGQYRFAKSYDIDEDTLELLRAGARSLQPPHFTGRRNTEDPFGLARTFTLELTWDLDGPADNLVDTLQGMARAASRVKGVETARLVPLRYTMTVPSNDPDYDVQWHHQAIASEAAWDFTMGDPDVGVAILDTGVEMDHPDLSDNLEPGRNITPRPSSAYRLPDHELADEFAGKNVPGDVAGHGTHIAGIVGAVEGNGLGGVGVAPRCRLIPVKTMTRLRSGKRSDLYTIHTTDIAVTRALLWAVQLSRVRVINISLGGARPTSDEFAALVAARKRDCVVTVSAGNGGAYELTYPGAYKVSRPSETDHMLVVGAVTEDNFIAHFSNFGEFVDLVAPGQNIYSTYLNEGYTEMSGTSMAAPIVAGVAALLYSRNPGATAKQVVETIKETARDLGPYQSDLFFGAGVVNAGRALRAFR